MNIASAAQELGVFVALPSSHDDLTRNGWVGRALVEG